MAYRSVCGNVLDKCKPLYTFIVNRTLHSTSPAYAQNFKNRKAGTPKVTVKKDRWLTYQESQPPHQIGVRKAWESWNTANLDGENGKPHMVMEDIFIRKFVYGTFQGRFRNIIIKRRFNMIHITGFCTVIFYGKIVFMVAYTEEILSHFLKCPVKLEIQVIRSYDAFKTI